MFKLKLKTIDEYNLPKINKRYLVDLYPSIMYENKYIIIHINNITSIIAGSKIFKDIERFYLKSPDEIKSQYYIAEIVDNE